MSCGECKQFKFKGLAWYCKLADKEIPKHIFSEQCRFFVDIFHKDYRKQVDTKKD